MLNTSNAIEVNGLMYSELVRNIARGTHTSGQDQIMRAKSDYVHGRIEIDEFERRIDEALNADL